MLTRTTNPNSFGWKWYGGRGITVCERWRKFENFLADMGERPEGKTLDRIDGDRAYEPRNCRWATHYEQQHNKPPTIGYVQRAVLGLLATGPRSAERLAHDWPMQFAEKRIRDSLRGMIDGGLIEVAGFERATSGRRVRIHKLTELGQQALARLNKERESWQDDAA